MTEDLELTNNIVNGYWYSFDYENKKDSKEDTSYDNHPLVYCYAPHQKSLNCFWAINLHHIGDKTARREFVEKMQKDKGFMNDEIRHIWTEDDLRRISKFCVNNAKRCYDKRKCYNIYRVKNGELGKYILTDGDLTRSNPTQEEIQWNLDRRNTKK